MNSMPEAGQGEEIYPMPAFPRLAVKDVQASTRWYSEALGFRVVLAPGGPGFEQISHLRWAKYADVMLVGDGGRETGPKGIGVSLYFTLNGSADVDALGERARQHSVAIVEGPVDRMWNVRELVVRDPDGYTLVFGGVIERNLSWDRLVDQIEGKR